MVNLKMTEPNQGSYTTTSNLSLFTEGEQGLSDNILAFLSENSIVLKGVLDQNIGFIIDSSQLANLFLNQPNSLAALSGENEVTLEINLPIADLNSSETGVSSLSENNYQNYSSQTTSSITSDPLETLNTPNIKIQNSCEKGAKKTRAKKVPTKRIFKTSEIVEPPIENGPFACNICSSVFIKWHAFKKHRAKHLNEKPFICQKTHCTMQFNFEINLKLHKMVHDAEESGNLQCQVCSSSFTRMASLKSHLRIHEKEETLVCQECGDELPTVNLLQSHLDEHKNRLQSLQIFICKECGTYFESQSLLSEHNKSHRLVRNEIKKITKQKRRVVQSSTKNKVEVATSSHLNVTPGENETDPVKNNRSRNKKKYVCSVCSKAFCKPSQLSRHFRIHSGEKPFGCPYPDCNKRFNQKSTLESHILACHQGLKPHKCELCKVSFSQKANLRIHLHNVHKPTGGTGAKKSFSCQECSCSYSNLTTLNTHISRVHSKPSSEPILAETRVIKINNDEALLTTTQINETSTSCTNSSKDQNTALVSHPSQSSSVEEINFVYGDNNGEDKRCLVKVKKVGKVKMSICNMCPKSFKKPSDLIRHIRTHTLERPFECEVCNKKFAVKSTLNSHMKTHYNNEKNLQCSVCSKRFSVLSVLKIHERMHTGSKPFKCLVCGKCFRTSSQRRVHTKAHSRQESCLTGKRKLLRIGEKSPLPLQEPLKITPNGLVVVPSKSSSLTQNNDAENSIPRPYLCNFSECTASFRKNSHLKQHVRSHTGERPFRCVKCQKCFISNSVLKNHIKSHEGIRDHICSICDQDFTTKGSLTRHLATHQSERPFICPYCGRSFKTSVATRKHIKTHSNDITDSPILEPFTITQENNLNIAPETKLVPLQASTVQNSNENQVETGLTYTEMNNFTSNMTTTIYEGEYLEINASNLIPQNQVLMNVNEALSSQNFTIVLPTDGQNSDMIQNIHSLSIQEYILEPIKETEVISSNQNQIQIHLSQPNNSFDFDPSLFNLQNGESIDLHFLQEDEDHTDEIAGQVVETLHQIQTQYTPKNLNTSEDSSLIKEGLVAFVLERTYEVESKEQEKTVVQSQNLANVIEEVDLVESFSPQIPPLPLPKPAQNLSKNSTKAVSEKIYSELASQEHKKRPISMSAREFIDDIAGKFNECPTCSVKFKKRSDLERHIRIHTGVKPYKCSKCGKAFRVKSTRQAHMRIHEETKQTEECHICKKTFSTKSSLRVHLRLHLNIKPYKCSFQNCQLSFRTSGHRKSHIQTHIKNLKEDQVFVEILN